MGGGQMLEEDNNGNADESLTLCKNLAGRAEGTTDRLCLDASDF
jgi:hypothetical protein